MRIVGWRSPEPGTPTNYRPPGAQSDGAWVPLIPKDQAVGLEADLYDGGVVPNVWRALSLVPDEVRAFFKLLAAQYMAVGKVVDVDTNDRAISRAQIELIASKVSALNQCFY